MKIINFLIDVLKLIKRTFKREPYTSTNRPLHS